MVIIGICDDEQPMRRALRQILEQTLQLQGMEYQILEYMSGEELVEGTKVQDLDILFLDIEMKALDGIKTAQILRKMGKKTVIIFVTAYPDFVFQGYEVHAFHYILKPYKKKKIARVMEQALEEAALSEEHYFMVEQKARLIRIPLAKTLAFCSERRKIRIIMQEETIEFYGKLDEAAKSLPEYFIRIHNRYIVNLNFMTSKVWLCAFACMATNIGSIYLAGYFVSSIRRDMEQRNLKLQQDYYKELEKNQAEIRKLRHDMNNHLFIMRDLFDTGDKETAEKYLNEVEKQITPASRRFCPDSIVNAVLNAKYNLAVSHGIDCFFHIDLPEIVAVDSVSLCSIISNTLDNAIEASVKIPDPENRRIAVKARIAENGFFSYEVTNAKINPVCMRKGRYLSDKENHASHGLGISNVREAVERYEGMLDISYTEDTFSVVILIGNAL